jgi:hypothetical protein
MHAGAIVMVVKQGWHFLFNKNASRAIQMILESKQLSVKIETSQSGSPPKFLGSPPKEPGSEKDKKTLSRHLSLSSEKREGHILPIDHQGGSVLFGVDASRKTTLSGPFEGFAVE